MKYMVYVFFSVWLATAVCMGSAQSPMVEDSFDADLSNWIVEQEPKGGAVRLVDGRLDINVGGGCTVWLKQKLSGPIRIEYEATMIQGGGPYDRVSDLNCFWMATDPGHPTDLFANSSRGGVFPNYHSLRVYYVGYGGHNNTKTRFRRYVGDGERPCLPEHDLSAPRYLLQSNQTMKITLIADGRRVQYIRDGEVIFDFDDENAYAEGWFGFRTVNSHIRIDHFRVYRLAGD